MKTSFIGKLDGEELVMDTTSLDVKEIRFNVNSREITVVQSAPKPKAKKAVAKKSVAKKAPAKKK